MKVSCFSPFGSLLLDLCPREFLLVWSKENHLVTFQPSKMERDIAKEKQEIWIEGREELSDDRRVTKNNSSAFREVWTRWKDDDWRCDGQLSDAPLLFSTKETLLSLNTVQVKQQERGLIDRCQWRPLNSDLICGFSDGVTDDGQVSKLFFCSWWSLEKKCWLCYDSFWIFWV